MFVVYPAETQESIVSRSSWAYFRSIAATEGKFADDSWRVEASDLLPESHVEAANFSMPPSQPHRCLLLFLYRDRALPLKVNRAFKLKVVVSPVTGGYDRKAIRRIRCSLIPLWDFQIGDIFQLAEASPNCRRTNLTASNPLSENAALALQSIHGVMTCLDLPDRPRLRDEVLAERLSLRLARQVSADFLGSGLGQWSFIHFRKFFLQLTGYDQLQNRVAEEFKRWLCGLLPLSCATEG